MGIKTWCFEAQRHIASYFNFYVVWRGGSLNLKSTQRTIFLQNQKNIKKFAKKKKIETNAHYCVSY